MKFYCTAFLIGLLYSNRGIAQTDTVLTAGHIIYDDPSLRKLIPEGAKLEIIGSGFGHTEGPVWYRDSSELLFSDTRASVVYRWSPVRGLSKFLVHSGFTGRLPYSEEPGSNGLAITKNGDLLMCEHGDRRVALFPLNGKYGKRTLTDNYQGKRFNSPNDIIIKSDGSYYMTDPSYGLPHKDTDKTRELNFNGVYRISPGGKATLLISDVTYPNGLAFSPGEKYFYLTNSDENKSAILRYPVKADGSLGKGNLFFDAANLPKNQQKQKVDGLKVDRFGNLWAAAPGGLVIVSPAGKLLGRVETYEVISNCTFDDTADNLYITAGPFLYRLHINQ